MDLSVVIPCLNEENTIKICVEKCINAFEKLGIEGEVIVSDNGSKDKSIELAKQAGAKVVHCKVKGYGATIQEGFKNAQGKFVLMGDGDDSYDFNSIGDFWQNIDKDFDMILGSRFKGIIQDGAMPPLHRYFGTPLLTFIVNFLFGTHISDSQSGMRFFRKSSLDKIKFKTTGMEFASELTVLFKLNKMKIIEIPINLYKDGRINGKPHLNPWRDGLRHLFYMLKMRITHLF
ncbi:glycosyltransferase family 2 protein [bacterium]|nr:glycosyltransferase family 2 protein [bacterium]